MSHEYDEPGQNERRADWAEAAFDGFRCAVMPGEGDVRTAMVDFIADLLHLMDRLGLEQDDTVEAGRQSYRQDLAPGEIGSAERVVRREARP